MNFMKVLFVLFLLLIILLSYIGTYEENPRCLFSRDPVLCVELTK